MQKQEFEERIERTVTDEQYKVIEERLSYNELQKGRHLLSPLPDACDHIHRAERACPYYREWMLHQTC